jgi:glycosyltransferase involved in cell wall biosynthesis
MIDAMSAPPRAVVVVPAFNEQATVGDVVRGIIAGGLPVVVVDDGSQDATSVVAGACGATTLRLPFNLGVGGALRCGFRWAVANGYDTVVQCDADGQHDPAELRRLIDVADQGAIHLLVGTRFAENSGFQATRIRRIPIRLLSRIATRAAGTTMSDASSGFRVVREPLLSEFARAYPVHYLGDTFEVLVQAGRRGYKVAELPVVMRERAGGTPSAGPAASVRFLVRAILALLIGSAHRYRQFEATSAARTQGEAR